jgi:isoamylase
MLHRDLDCVYVAANSYWEPQELGLPAAPDGMVWHRFADTSAAAPDDICEPGSEPRLGDQATVTVGARSVLVLTAGGTR